MSPAKPPLCATVCLLLALLAPPSWAQNERSGTVKSVAGTVTIVRDQQSIVASVGEAIQAGDRIETGPHASVGFSLVDGTRMTMESDTQAAVETFQFNGTTQQGSLLLRLYRGTLRMITGWIAKTDPNAVQVVTPTSVIGVRGTDFIVHVAGH